MIRVMHWAVKTLRKKRLSEATSISLSVDDRKEYRLVRYRCDVPPAAPSKQPLEEGCVEAPGKSEQGGHR